MAQIEFENQTKEIIEAQQGNEQAMSRLLENNKGLIWSIVKRFSDRGYELEDLYQVGAIGFIKCIKRFDSSFDVRLSTYAVPYILGEIKRYLRDNGPIKVSRSLKEMAIKAIDMKNSYYKKTGQEIRIEELAKMLETSKEELALALESFQPINSIDEQIGGETEDGMTLLEKMAGTVDEEMQVTNKLCIEQMIQKLKQQEKQVILLRYYKGRTQSEVAKILGITQVQVSRIERKALNLMRMKLVV